jgi:hypothetical protein
MSEQGGEARNEPSPTRREMTNVLLMTASMHIRVRCDENKKGATAEDILLRWIASVHRRGEDREIGRHAPPNGS